MDENKLFYIRFGILFVLFVIMLVVIEFFFQFPKLRYEIALAVIGTIVTVMGIFIAFDLQFPTERYYKEYDTYSDMVSDFKKQVPKFKAEISRNKDLNYLTEILSTISQVVFTDLFDQSRREVKSRTVISVLGLVVIIWFIMQPFIWQIDNNNQISSRYVEILILSLLFAFLWIGGKINILYSENITLYDRLSKRVEEIREFIEKNNQKEV